jgi:hypothetical protein
MVDALSLVQVRETVSGEAKSTEHACKRLTGLSPSPAPHDVAAGSLALVCAPESEGPRVSKPIRRERRAILFEVRCAQERR